MEVNLFSKKLSKVKKKQLLKFWSIKGLIALTLLLAMSMILVSAWSLAIARKSVRVETDIDKTKEIITSMSDIESKQVYLISKLTSFASLLDTHEKHQAVTETVFALIPNGTTLKGFQVSEGGEILLSGTVPNFQILNELMDRVKSKDQYRMPIESAKMTKVTFSKDGVISFNMILSIGGSQT